MQISNNCLRFDKFTQTRKCFLPSVVISFFFLHEIYHFTTFFSLLSHTVLSTLLIIAVCRTRVITNSVNMTSLATSRPVAQWLAPTGVQEVMGSIHVGDSDFFLFPTLVTTEYPIFSMKKLLTAAT